MGEYGEWTRKGATLSDVTARREYGVDSDFIVKGIDAGRLEHREGAIHGNPYIRVLRGQLEAYIAEELLARTNASSGCGVGRGCSSRIVEREPVPRIGSGLSARRRP